MAVTNLMIGIGAEYKGRGAFKQAETATQKLTKSVRNLAGAFGIAFGTRAVVNFAKVSLKAFQESEAQQQRLARLLQVTNDASAAQIAILTRQADALEQLGVVSAGSITQVQSQLATFDLQILTINKLTPAILDYVTAEKGAAATADDFKAATNGLAQALNGNFASLTKTGFVLDDVTKELISTGTESERAAAIVKVLDSTYKGFNRSLRDTPSGQFIILANAADDARVIIGEGLTKAIKSAFGGGDIESANKNIKEMGQVISDIIQGLGTMTGAVVKLVQATDKLTLGRVFQNMRESGSSNSPFDPMAMKAPDLTPGFMALVRAQEKADALSLKRQKERTAELKKQTKEQKAQAALAKARAVLEKADTVFNMDLIQNTAALMGKVTEDETVRLKLQQAILLGNADEAGNLAQQLAASQIAAMKLSSTNPLGGFTDALKAALGAVRQIRNELEKLGAPKVPVASLELDAQNALLDASNFEFEQLLKDTNDARNQLNKAKTLAGQLGLGIDLTNYQDAFSRPNASSGYMSNNPNAAINELRIVIDPTAAQYGIGVASVNNSANGNNNNYSTIQSFSGGL
jgi:hypothetical protein